jgi:hypothetical protein
MEGDGGHKQLSERGKGKKGYLFIMAVKWKKETTANETFPTVSDPKFEEYWHWQFAETSHFRTSV